MEKIYRDDEKIIFDFLRENKEGYFTTEGLNGTPKQSKIRQHLTFTEDGIPVINIEFVDRDHFSKHGQNLSIQSCGNNKFDQLFTLTIIGSNGKGRARIFGLPQILKVDSRFSQRVVSAKRTDIPLYVRVTKIFFDSPKSDQTFKYEFFPKSKI